MLCREQVQEAPDRMKLAERPDAMPQDDEGWAGEHERRTEHVADAEQSLHGNLRGAAQALESAQEGEESAAQDDGELPDDVPATVVSVCFSPNGQERQAVLLRDADRVQDVFPVPDFCCYSCSYPRDAVSLRTDYRLFYCRFSHPSSRHPDDYPKSAVRFSVADDVRRRGYRDGYLPMKSMSRLQ